MYGVSRWIRVVFGFVSIVRIAVFLLIVLLCPRL